MTSIRRRIVVGVDGSPGSYEALRWALDEARVRQWTVEAICVWRYPVPLGLPYADAQVMANVDFEGEARATLAAAVAAVSGDREEVRVDQYVVCGHPAERLVAAAKGADLLVVGSRGRGGFVGLVLGSVSRQCTEHAPCPVVIVPELVGAQCQP